MDGITEKFTVVDFFNLIIAGIVFDVFLGAGYYSKFWLLFKEILMIRDNLFIVNIVIAIFFLTETLVVGLAIQVLAHYFFAGKFECEKRLIEDDLIKGMLFDNKERTEAVLYRVRQYFDLETNSIPSAGKFECEKRLIEDDLIKGMLFDNKERTEAVLYRVRQYFDLETNSIPSADQCNAFYIYCVYYLHINKLDDKIEKIYETQGLSKLLTCALFSIPICRIMIFHANILYTGGIDCGSGYNLFICVYETQGLSKLLTCALFSIPICRIMIFHANILYTGGIDCGSGYNLFICVLSGILGYLFYCRYKISSKNRIKMILSMYDVYMRVEENKRNGKKL